MADASSRLTTRRRSRSARPIGSSGSSGSGRPGPARSTATGSGSATRRTVAAQSPSRPRSDLRRSPTTPPGRRIAHHGDDRAGAPDHRPRRRHRRRRHGAGDTARRVRTADRRPGRLGRDRAPPADAAPRTVGRHADPRRGRIGVAYGAPRLRADAVDVVGRRVDAGTARPPRRAGRGERVAPGDDQRPRHRASTSSAIAGGRRSASGPPTWSSSASPGPGIASTALVEGRLATVTGIVRRPYPERQRSSLRRDAALPRGRGRRRPDRRRRRSRRRRADLDPERSTATAPTTPGRSRRRRRPRRPRRVRRSRTSASAGSSSTSRPTASRSTTGPRSAGSSSAARRSTARPRSSRTTPSTLIGRVEADADGPIVVVDDPGRLYLRGRSGAGGLGGRCRRGAGGGRRRIAGAVRRTGGTAGWRVSAAAACRSMPAPPGSARWPSISAASVAVTLLRREQSRRRLAARIAARLATLGGPAGRRRRRDGRLSVGQARSTRLDARENAGLSSAEFRASEAAT